MSFEWLRALHDLNEERVASLGLAGIGMDVIAETAVARNGNVWPSSPRSYLERHRDSCTRLMNDDELSEQPMTDDDIEQAFQLLVRVGLLTEAEHGYRVNPKFVRFAR